MAAAVVEHDGLRQQDRPAHRRHDKQIEKDHYQLQVPLCGAAHSSTCRQENRTNQAAMDSQHRARAGFDMGQSYARLFVVVKLQTLVALR